MTKNNPLFGVIYKYFIHNLDILNSADGCKLSPDTRQAIPIICKMLKKTEFSVKWYCKNPIYKRRKMVYNKDIMKFEVSGSAFFRRGTYL